MKKFIILSMLILGGISVSNAQIYRSVSRKIERIETPKVKRVYDNNWGHDWFVKAGAGILFWPDEGTPIKYNLKGGYRKQIHGIGLYFGGEIGLTSSVFYSNQYVSSYWGSYYPWIVKPAILIEPMFGIKYRFSGTTSVDAHIACGYERVLAKHWHKGNVNRIAAEVGLGFWFNRFFVGLETQLAASDYAFDIGLAANLGVNF